MSKALKMPGIKVQYDHLSQLTFVWFETSFSKSLDENSGVIFIGKKDSMG